MRIVRRCDRPIIGPQIDGGIGTNINGPSPIRVPPWIEKPLGRYYLYFAHHRGHYIRLAYADDPTGPWHIHDPGTLHMDQTPFTGHIASPDLHVDQVNRQLVMYYHGLPRPGTNDQNQPVPPPRPWTQPTMRAVSNDGLHWHSDQVELGESYFRVFWFNGWCYALANNGRLYKSRDGVREFERREEPLGSGKPGSVRHWALWPDGGTLHTLFSRRNEAPEHLLYAPIDLTQNWDHWALGPVRGVLSPRVEWEGVNEPIIPSADGPAHRPVHQLRDPAILREPTNTWLFYAVAGERGISVAQVLGL